MVLFAVFPGSFVLSFTYSEATLIVLAAACLLFLLREQWWLAGIAAMLGTATRPNGVGARGGLRGRQLPGDPPDARLDARSSRWCWRRSASSSSSCTSTTRPASVARGSGCRARPGRRGRASAPPRSSNTARVLHPPAVVADRRPDRTVDDRARRDGLVRLEGPALIPCWPRTARSSSALMLVTQTVTARPRFLITAFPLLIAVAAWWPRHDDAVPSGRLGRDDDDRLTLEPAPGGT